MRILIIVAFLSFTSKPAKADLWGADLPLLAEIVTNTLYTMIELQKQTQHLRDEMRGINDRLERIRSIAKVVQPSEWKEWRNPEEALRRMRLIYHTLPKEYRSEKSDMIEHEISNAMNLVSQISRDTKSIFESGKQLESRARTASPGVAQKMTASGVGTLVALESQSQVIQSHIVSLLSQTLADANEKETRRITSLGKSYKALKPNIGDEEQSFSKQALKVETNL